MKPEDKKIIKVTEALNCNHITTEQFLETIEDLKVKYDNVSDIEIYSGYDAYLYLEFSRLELPSEYLNRLKQEEQKLIQITQNQKAKEQIAIKRKQKEYEQYIKLKEKYEK